MARVMRTTQQTTGDITISVRLHRDEYDALVATIDEYNRRSPAINIAGLLRWLAARWVEEHQTPGEI